MDAMLFRASVSVLCSALLVPAPIAPAQEQRQTPESPSHTVMVVRSNLVLVPTLVKTKRGDVVFSLQADDFTLLDDGVPQPIRLEPNTDSQPLAIVVAVQTGGQSATHLHDYAGLAAVLEAVVGEVPHQIAVVSFDSHAHLKQEFSPDTDKAAAAISKLVAGDSGAAILDGLKFATDLLRKEPPSSRRALLLFSETIDNGSSTSLDETLRDIEDTNTTMYGFGLSSTKTALKHEGAKLPNPLAQTTYSATPYPKDGCMSRAPNADPDSHGNRSIQALDCASDLFPPLRIARMAYIAAKDQMKANVPESVARLTGGEYFRFRDANSLRRDLIVISNDVPNRYVLSFRPMLPHPGLHAIALSLRAPSGFVVEARRAYWVGEP